MAASSDPGFLVLHALRLKGFAETGVVAALTGLDEAEASKHLDAASADGQATRRDGRISGWALTSDGRARHAELIRDELEVSGTRDVVEDGYRRFLELNSALLGVCTDWQLRNGALNDHEDATYDTEIVARLAHVDDEIQPVTDDLGDALERFGEYGPRFRGALAKVRNGERDWFAKPMIDSYHTIWFELHEDLLVTLGIERSKEGSA
ncbi:MAG TPA: hypothetical protein VM143_07905 [Acidimicrobiales bacterium]|nr:hypothetical protein [Acidimicrobiales bacterium]